jgi:fatty-acyl-CoA synthase
VTAPQILPRPESTYQLLLDAAGAWPDGVAMRWIPDPGDYTRCLTWTYADLAGTVTRIANALAALGVRRQDAVTLSGANTSMLYAATLAAQAVGIAAPVNPALSGERIAGLIRRTGSRVLVAAGPELDPQAWSRLLKVARQADMTTVLALRPDGARGAGAPPAPSLREDAPSDGTPNSRGPVVAYLDDVIAGQPSDRLAAGDRPSAADLAAFVHTGGTTGDPKIAAHTHANQLACGQGIAQCNGLASGEAVLGGLPLFHVNALLVTGIAPMFSGTQVVWPGPAGYRDPALYSRFWKIVEHYRIAAMSAVPTVYGTLAQVPVDADISSLRIPIVGAAPLPSSVREDFARHTGCSLLEGYGLTEATCASTWTRPAEERPGSVGRALPGQQVKAVRVGDDGSWTDCAPDETGVLAVGGPAVFAGYVDGPRPGGFRLSREGVVRHGWLDTGDLGRVDADGFVYLAGRAKDLIIRGGHNIDPRVIEEVLLRHPAVRAAAAVGRPDRHSGEVPVAYVVPADPRRFDEAELLAWADAIDEPAARPKRVYQIDAIPLTAVGKQFKPALAADAAVRAATEALAAAGLPDAVVAAAHERGSLVVTVTGADPGRIRRALGGFTFTVRSVPSRAAGPRPAAPAETEKGNDRERSACRHP